MYKRYFKRMFDLIFSILGLPAFFLVLLIITPLIYVEDRGPVLYNAYRLGKDGKVFKMYKFRSMKIDSPDLRNDDGSTYNCQDDIRITRMGRIMRKTSIDELPQLLNVLKGDMSFVGPRPNLANGSYGSFDEIRKRRLEVRPGITGYSQAYFRNSILQEEKFLNDIYYIEHLNFIFDTKILFQTAKSVLKRKNIYIEQKTLEAKENET